MMQAIWIYRLAVFLALMPGHWLAAALLWGAGDCWRRWSGRSGQRLLDVAMDPVLVRAGMACVPLLLDDAKAKGKANAGFSGPPWRRVLVLSPALRAGLNEEQRAAVLAHEAGHCRLRHEELWLAGGTLFWIVLLGGMAALGDPLLMPLAALAGWGVARLSQPLLAALRRRWELEADAYAASIVGAAAMASALRRLERINGPVRSPFHPPLEERLSRLSAA